jgi:tryptophanase
MENLKKLRALIPKNTGIRIIHDMTRVAENAYFIQQKEKGYADIEQSNKSSKAICDPILTVPP